MAETFLFNITERVLTKVSNFAIQQISLVWHFREELDQIESTLYTIRAVLLDADEQQASNHGVRVWLEKLKDVVYDIEDLLDELSTEALLQKGQRKNRFLRNIGELFSCSSLLAFRFKIGSRIVGIRKRLDYIASDRNKFHFTENVQWKSLEKIVREQTHSFVRASDIIGREKDKEFIVELLLSPACENVSVIPIVGLGGLGKTTLAKMAYNDPRVFENFELGMWVSVSEDFSLNKVIQKILKSATGENNLHLDMDQMQKKLHAVLNSKKYLLVLDDVWNEDRSTWMDLMELLMNSHMGSRIIVTTRSKIVAQITGTVDSYFLSGLSDDDCFSLFLKCAFRGLENRILSLVEIGEEIVKKCSGVPLAVKTLASMLYMKTDEQEWLHIRDNEIWKIEQNQTHILPILRLSYEQMPPHLRQCFAYCSILPRGYEIPRESFINLWIALGLIKSDNNRDQDNIGNKYFNELLSRFCFQDIVEAFDGEILACKIHNLVHDLAQSVSVSDCTTVKSNVKSVSENIRHVLFHSEDMAGTEFPQELLKLKKLRSFSTSLKLGPIDGTFTEIITLRFRCLRVLMLNTLDLKELPSSFGDLKQLRYLDLSHCSNLMVLPSSFCKLVNLQTLNLISCDRLKGLPENFHHLISLRTLYLTAEDMFIRKKSFLQNKSLRFLLLYKYSLQRLPSEGLQNLTALRVLRIYECPKLTSLPSSIKYLTSLEKLWIWDCEELDLQEENGLEGLTSLQSLLLMGLPKLGTLDMALKQDVAANLKYLRIANCPNLTTLSSSLHHCSSLLKLYVEDCPSLSSFSEGIQNHIAKVHIRGCPLLI